MEIGTFLKKVTGSVIGIDTMAFIYVFEENHDYLDIVKQIFEKMEKGDIKGVTSAITVSECLVKPFEAGDISLIARYKVIFRNFPNLTVFPLNLEIAVKAAEIKSKYKVRTPDAIQLATALHNNASLFITNDLFLSKVANMAIVQLKEFK